MIVSRFDFHMQLRDVICLGEKLILLNEAGNTTATQSD